MNIYDVNWNLLDPKDVDDKKGYLIPTRKKTIVSEAHDEYVIWDSRRDLRRIIHVPEKIKFEDCQQYILYSNSELIGMYSDKLRNTDYIAMKMAEAIAYGDTDLLEEYKYKYADILKKRKIWRVKINELQNGVT